VAKVEPEKKPEKKVEKKKGDNRVARYVRETWFEMKKVSWPTRSEGVNLTLIVVAVTAFLSLVLGLMDYVYSAVFRLFL
jgi:preprotein translocase subunit SecE